jgi:hypothetical protein
VFQQIPPAADAVNSQFTCSQCSKPTEPIPLLVEWSTEEILKGADADAMEANGCVAEYFCSWGCAADWFAFRAGRDVPIT